MRIRLKVRRPALWNLLGQLLIVLGLGAVLYSVYFVLDGTAYQTAQRTEFVRELEAAPAAVSSQSSGTPAALRTKRTGASHRPERDARAFAQLRIPSVDLEVMVREGLDSQTLRRAAGHLASSAKPGERGNVVLLGHRDTFFRPLRGLRRGAIAEIQTAGGLFRYRIEEIKVIAPEFVDVSQPLDRSEITLVTCFPFTYLGPSPQRFVAQGRLIASPGD